MASHTKKAPPAARCEAADDFEPASLLRPPTARAAYSDRTSWMMAVASKLAYLRFERREDEYRELEERLRKAGFRLAQIFDTEKHDTQAYLAVHEKLAILAFRGTTLDGVRDILTDIRTRFHDPSTRSKGRTHSGFQKAYDDVKVEIADAIAALGDTPLYITGHSLGGALATVAAADNRHDNVAAVYTFGAPRVGDGDFDFELKTPVYRVEHKSDIVPRTPLKLSGFTHVGYLHYIKGDGNVLRKANYLFRTLAFWGWSLTTILIKPIRDHRIDCYIAALRDYAIKRTSNPNMQGRQADLLFSLADFEAPRAETPPKKEAERADADQCALSARPHPAAAGAASDVSQNADETKRSGAERLQRLRRLR